MAETETTYSAPAGVSQPREPLRGLHELRWLLRLYLRLAGARVRSQVTYRTSFALQVAGSFLTTGIEFAAIAVIFSHLPRLDGWSLGEVALLYALSYSAFGMADLIVGHLDQLPNLMLRGEFDQILARPLPALFQLIALDVNLRKIGAVAQALVALGIALALLDIHWTAGRVLVLAITPLCGTVIFVAVWVLGATSTFWSTRTMELVNAVTYGGNQLTTYPMGIYSAPLRRLFTFVLPLAFVDYYPALYLLNKPDPLGLPHVARFLAPLAAAALLLVTRPVWAFGVRHYRSTGS